MNWPLALAVVAAILFGLEALRVAVGKGVPLIPVGLCVLAIAFAVQWDK